MVLTQVRVHNNIKEGEEEMSLEAVQDILDRRCSVKEGKIVMTFVEI